MKIRAALLVLAAFGTIAAIPWERDADEAKKELEKLQGVWVIVSAERDGMTASKEELEGLKRTVKGDEFTVSKDGQVINKGKYKLDPSKKPKAIDAFSKNPMTGEDVTLQGIYEFDGDNYKVCFAQPGMPRPTEFKTSEGSGRTLTVSKRAGK